MVNCLGARHLPGSLFLFFTGWAVSGHAALLIANQVRRYKISRVEDGSIVKRLVGGGSSCKVYLDIEKMRVVE